MGRTCGSSSEDVVPALKLGNGKKQVKLYAKDKTHSRYQTRGTQRKMPRLTMSHARRPKREIGVRAALVWLGYSVRGGQFVQVVGGKLEPQRAF